MSRKRKTELEQERMTDPNLRRVIALLEPTEPDVKAITKKEACAILGMSYNTARLQQILDDYKQRVVREQKRRAELRGKPASSQDVQHVVTEYLTGNSVDGIAKSMYRSAQFVKTILEKYSVPIRKVPWDYFSPALIPDGATKNQFKLGEVAYSARYDSLAKVIKEQYNETKNQYEYRVWLLADKWQQYAYTEAHELASLEHLREAGIKV
jgi:hypothetical protein